MTRSMLKAWTLGAGILFLGHVMWSMVLNSHTYPELLALTLKLLPTVAAFATAYLAPRKKILLGISMALLGAVLTSAFNFIYEAFDLPVDFAGPRGAPYLFMIALASNAFLCTIGSVAGYFLTKPQPGPR